MNTIHSAHPKFELGDVVQFNSVYNYGDAAAPDTDYTVVEEVTKARFGDVEDQTVNGFTREIALRLVNYRPYDFMLISRKEKGMEVCKIIEEVSTRAEMDSALASRIDNMVQVKDVAPITVTVNADKFNVNGSEMSEFIRAEIEKHLEQASRPGGQMFGSAPIGLIGEQGAESILPVTRVKGFGYLLADKDGSRVEVDTDGSTRVYDSDGVIRVRMGYVSDSVTPDEVDGKIKSTGGSSSYYDIPLPDELMNKLFDRWEKGNAHIRTEELIRYALSNDFDYGTSFKSMIRAHAITHLGSGKAGNDVDYELNKQDWSNNKVRQRFGKKADE